MLDLSSQALVRHFALDNQPFGVSPDPRFLFMTEQHRAAIAKLEFGIRCNRGFIALVAPPGLGKTTLLYHLLDKFRTSGCASTAFIFHTQCDSRELVRQLITDLGIEDTDQDLIRMNQRLREFLVHEINAGRNVVLFIDEAQNLSEDALETVRLLSNFETSSLKLLQIVLAGQPALAYKISSPRLVQLRQRLFAMPQLKPLSTWETNDYIDHRLSMAGCRNKGLFTPGARTLLVSKSRGIPREINSLCFNALATGYKTRVTIIDETVVRRSIAEAALPVFGTSDGEFPEQQTETETPTPRLKVQPYGDSDQCPAKQVLQPEVTEPSQQKKADNEVPKAASQPISRTVVDEDRDVAQRGLPRVQPAADELLHRTKRYIVGATAMALLLMAVLVSGFVYITRSVRGSEPSAAQSPGVDARTQPVESKLAIVGQKFESEGQKRKSPSQHTGPRKEMPSAARAAASTIAPGASARASAKPLSSSIPATAITAISTSRLDSSPANTATAEAADPNGGPDLQAEGIEPAPAVLLDTPVISEAFQTRTEPSRDQQFESTSSGRAPVELLYSTRPQYPASAIAERIQGTVVLRAVISPIGSVLRLEKVSGTAVLADAAIHAVRGWRYRPVMVHGKPVEVETWVVLRFSLSDR